MSRYIIKGNEVEIIPDGSINLIDKLPPDVYFLKQKSLSESFYLEKSNEFNISNKVYGNFSKRTDKIIGTFLERSSNNVNTGVLLSGRKGCGKTLQAKLVSSKLHSIFKIPTIVISNGFDSNNLSLFIKDISDRVLIIFEEFEKNYSSETRRRGETDSQDGLLTLLDGVMESSNKLFIFTCNDPLDITDLLINRPGRVYYHFKYNGISDKVVYEYCQDKLTNEDHINDIIKLSEIMSNGFTFDMLQAIVEETIREDESPIKLIGDLNIEPVSMPSRYIVETNITEVKIISIGNNGIVKIIDYLDESYTPEFEIKFLVNTPEELSKFKVIYKDITLREFTDDFVCNGNFEEGEIFNVTIELKRSNIVSISKDKIVYKFGNYIITLIRQEDKDDWQSLFSIF